jgi:hypothetical protein
MEKKEPQNPKNAYKIKWDAENTKQYKLKLMLRTDQDIIEKLDSVPNRQGYLKDLIRKDIAKDKGE